MRYQQLLKWCVVGGSLITVIGFFLPWLVVSVNGLVDGSVVATQTQSANGPTLASVVGDSSKSAAIWAVLGTAGIIGIIALFFTGKASTKVVQGILHAGQAGALVLNLFQALGDGSLQQAVQQQANDWLAGYCQTQTDIPAAECSAHISLATQVQGSSGLLLMGIGLLIAAAGIYLPKGKTPAPAADQAPAMVVTTARP